MTTPAAALDRHIADSLVGVEIEELAAARSIADLGAGAGLPGLVLALALPAARIDLIESIGRKCAVIDRLAEAAGLVNARSHAVRAEDHAAQHRDSYDAVTARAVAPLAVLVEYAAPLLGSGGAFVAWKGRRDDREEHAGHIAAHTVGLDLDRIVRVRPFSEATDRHLHVFRKTARTPDRFPRRAGMARKRPLA